MTKFSDKYGTASARKVGIIMMSFRRVKIRDVRRIRSYMRAGTVMRSTMHSDRGSDFGRYGETDIVLEMSGAM